MRRLFVRPGARLARRALRARLARRLLGARALRRRLARRGLLGAGALGARALRRRLLRAGAARRLPSGRLLRSSHRNSPELEWGAHRSLGGSRSERPRPERARDRISTASDQACADDGLACDAQPYVDVTRAGEAFAADGFAAHRSSRPGAWPAGGESRRHDVASFDIAPASCDGDRRANIGIAEWARNTPRAGYAASRTAESSGRCEPRDRRGRRRGLACAPLLALYCDSSSSDT